MQVISKAFVYSESDPIPNDDGVIVLRLTAQDLQHIVAGMHHVTESSLSQFRGGSEAQQSFRELRDALAKECYGE